jgi:nicotinate-nucleotide adenylyltransferase
MSGKVGTPVRRIGVFGGAFDPPHLAHRALTEVALHQLKLDELRVLPTGQAWHKERPLTSAVHRLVMVELAMTGLPGVVVDDREVRREGPSYTLDTLRELQTENPTAEFFLVMGKDQADVLNTWSQWRSILDIATICVADRDGLTGLKTQFVPPPDLENRFRKLHMPTMDISATGIRYRVAIHQGIAPLVSPDVASYIEAHHLYSTT